MDEDIEITEGSENVFADLGLPDADELLVKASLARRIRAIVAARGWSQSRAAREMGIDQPKLSDISRGKLRGYSVERLAGYLNRLDEDVEIRTHPRREAGRPARTIVVTDERVAAAADPGASVRFD